MAKDLVVAVGRTAVVRQEMVVQYTATNRHQRTPPPTDNVDRVYWRRLPLIDVVTPLKRHFESGFGCLEFLPNSSAGNKTSVR
jgi:hypothetical protein